LRGLVGSVFRPYRAANAERFARDRTARGANIARETSAWGVTIVEPSTKGKDRALPRPQCCSMPFAQTFVEADR
jgi:hypothetical protein